MHSNPAPMPAPAAEVRHVQAAPVRLPADNRNLLHRYVRGTVRGVPMDAATLAAYEAELYERASVMPLKWRLRFHRARVARGMQRHARISAEEVEFYAEEARLRQAELAEQRRAEAAGYRALVAERDAAARSAGIASRLRSKALTRPRPAWTEVIFIGKPASVFDQFHPTFRVKDDQGLHVCPLCDYWPRSVRRMADHLRKAHGLDPFTAEPVEPREGGGHV